MGVWIETGLELAHLGVTVSHPTWVCGLKQKDMKELADALCHTLRGCVD